MMKNVGYDKTIKKILEFKHESIFKIFIHYLYSNKKKIFIRKEKII